MRRPLNLTLKSIAELEQLLRGPLEALDREAIERELRQRENRPLRGMFESNPADVAQGRLF